MKKVLFIVNPKSGKGTIKGQLLDILDLFCKADMEVTVYITQKAMDACRVTEEQGGDYDLLVCSGGDGTLDEVMTGLMLAGHKTAVGYIPAGSTNDFANSLKIPPRAKEAVDIILENHPYACDIGSFNGDYFVYIAAFGLFTDVSYQTNQDMKNVLGHMAYVLEGAKRLFNIKYYHLKIRTREREIEGDFLFGMVTNSESVGGFRNITGKNVCLNDGVFEVILIRKPTNPVELQEILTSILAKEAKCKSVETFRTDYVEFISSDPIPWTLDGENGGKHKRVEIINHREAIRIMVKKETK